jgi:hypothetical protein
MLHGRDEHRVVAVIEQMRARFNDYFHPFSRVPFK